MDMAPDDPVFIVAHYLAGNEPPDSDSELDARGALTRLRQADWRIVRSNPRLRPLDVVDEWDPDDE